MTENISITTNESDITNKPLLESVAIAKKKSRKLPKSVRPEEFIELVKEVPASDIKTKIAFLLAYASGMRISEVLRCKAEHFKTNQIFIPESKYGVERIVPKPKGWKESFFSKLPLQTSARTLERKFKKYALRAGLSSRYTFHSLRHGFATRMLESGVPINQVQLLLGHSNISTTSIYVKANPSDALKSYEDLF